MNWHDRIKRAFTTRYTRTLEDEIVRLRNENRALINSILSIAGLPPWRLEVEVARENYRNYGMTNTKVSRSSGAHVFSRATSDKATPLAHAAPNSSLARTQDGPRDTPSTQGGPGTLVRANAHRRRSWQQINRILEIEGTREMKNRDNHDAMQTTARSQSAALPTEGPA